MDIGKFEDDISVLEEPQCKNSKSIPDVPDCKVVKLDSHVNPVTDKGRNCIRCKKYYQSTLDINPCVQCKMDICFYCR